MSQGEVIQLILAKEAQDAIEARELAKLTYKRPQRQTALTRRANIAKAAKRTGYVATDGHEAAIAYHVAQSEGWTETAPYDTHNSPVKRLVSTTACERPFSLAAFSQRCPCCAAGVPARGGRGDEGQGGGAAQARGPDGAQAARALRHGGETNLLVGNPRCVHFKSWEIMISHEDILK